MNRLFIFVVGWLGAAYIFILRLTLRFDIQGDPRPALKAAGQKYVYAILHAQQLSFVTVSDDVPIAAMVSRSRAGEALVPSCWLRNIIAVRGSKNKSVRNKGGREALAKMADHVREGLPALLAVDGPRGPRNLVQWGVVDLAIETGSFVMIAGVFPKRRSVIRRTWDRAQVPGLFTTMHIRFRPPVDPTKFKDRAELRAYVMKELLELEREHDPVEAAHVSPEVLAMLAEAGLEPRSAAPVNSEELS
jgi:lysophospholipid acyltransferase (LPLAT)-like uncharacterized protein